MKTNKQFSIQIVPLTLYLIQLYQHKDETHMEF